MRKLLAGLVMVGGAVAAIRGVASMRNRKRQAAEEAELELEVERMEGEGGPASA